MSKLFIISLPRTGTTSVSVSLLDCGFKVAHTAYTKHAFELADVVSDTPCFCDYPQLDKVFPGSKFLYLERPIDSWIPSIQMLLNKVLAFMEKKPDKLSPVLIRCFETIFHLTSAKDPFDCQYLASCYIDHQKQVYRYFSGRDDFLKIDVTQNDGLSSLLSFLGCGVNQALSFPKLNAGRMINAWDEVRHPNKVGSHSFGPERRKYFDFDS